MKYRGSHDQVCHTLDLIDPFIAKLHVQVDLIGIDALSSQVLCQGGLCLQLGYCNDSYLGFKVIRSTILFALRYSWYLEESRYVYELGTYNVIDFK